MGAPSLGRAAQASAMEKPHHPQRLPPAPEECLRCHFNAFGGSALQVMPRPSFSYSSPRNVINSGNYQADGPAGHTGT